MSAGGDAWWKADLPLIASPYQDRIVGKVEELMKFTPLTRGCAHDRVDRYSEREESGEDLMRRVNQGSL